jgi:hypothetical protein
VKFKGPFMRAKCRPRSAPGTMNNTEAEYAARLNAMVAAGEYIGWRYEAYTLRLAPKTTYTPDFVVQLPTREIEVHEVKACKANGSFLCEDDARVKIKVAAEMFTEFRFFLCGKLPKKSGGGWKIEEVGTK